MQSGQQERRFWQGSLAGIAVLLLCATSHAAPPILFSADHYDPDWPVVSTVLMEKCFGCHRPGTERTDLSNYDALLAAAPDYDDTARVVLPGDAKNSLIWDYVAWNAKAEPHSRLPDQPQMPPDHHEWLSAGQLEALERWINNGAHQYRLPDTCRENAPLSELDFPSAKQCAACHPRQYDEWSRSMHAYGQQSPVFEAFNLTMIERTEGTVGTFCTRCHTPIGTSLGENGSVRNVNRSRLSNEGVTCVACHRRHDRRYKASGRIPVTPGGVLEGCVFGPFDDSPSQELGAHPSQGSPYIKSAQFCGECHDVTNPAGVRLEEAFSEWQHSPAAAKGITCQLCHMGPMQGVPVPESHRPLGRAAVVPGIPPEKLPLRRLTNHTFAGPDYSLLPDTEFPHKLDWMYEVDYRNPRLLTPYQHSTLHELRLKNRKSLATADALRFELLKNAAHLKVRHPPQAACGSQLAVEVDVKSTTAGHEFPTGFTAERQLWVEVTVRDPLGRIVFASGDLDSNGDLRDEHSYQVLAGKVPFDPHLVNFQNKFTVLANKGTDRSVVVPANRDLAPISLLRPAEGPSISFGRPQGFRIAKGSLTPLSTFKKKYPVRLPALVGTYMVEARLQFRHLPPTLLDHIGVGQYKPQLQIVTIDSYQAVIQVFP